MYCILNSVYFGQFSLVSYLTHLRCLVQLFKVEDVSMGMWVEGFNAYSRVQYSHNWTFCQLFKMEHVSMGMWVEGFNASSRVQYSHNWKFCQYGCTNDYCTAHYKSPRQMLCMWDKLLKGKVEFFYL
jgi:hypothetical protein